MNDKQLIELITRVILENIDNLNTLQGQSDVQGAVEDTGEIVDLTGEEYKKSIEFVDPENQLALRAMRRETTGRIGIGHVGPRLTTKAVISLRADHALAKDAVQKNIDEEILKSMDLPTITSKCSDINEHLTRPDIGRTLSEDAISFLKQKCIQQPQVQIYVSDGLSNSAVEENICELLPILTEGLKERNIKVGTPFFLKYGRVPTSDKIAEVLGAECTCVLLGERPGLAASDSMSAYITYGGYVGVPEAKRTVVSNIHKNGIQPIEAGAYLVDIIIKIIENKKSGVDLQS